MTMSRDSVTLDGIWVGNRIYFTRDYTIFLCYAQFSVTVYTAIVW
jgi:hypothetical protein